jgi:hypothetical protein
VGSYASRYPAFRCLQKWLIMVQILDCIWNPNLRGGVGMNEQVVEWVVECVVK